MSNKRCLEEEVNRHNPNKRVRSSQTYSVGSTSVSIQLTLNQLLNRRPINSLSKTNGFEGQTNGTKDNKCFNCLTKCYSVWISCNFCERNVCDDCSLTCFRCTQAYCRLCAVKCYQFSHQNNVGICLSCNP